MTTIFDGDQSPTPNEQSLYIEWISKIEQYINWIAHNRTDLKILFVYMKIINKQQTKSISPSILDIEPIITEMDEMIDIILHSTIYLRTLHMRQSPIMPIIIKMETKISHMSNKMHQLYKIYTQYMEQIIILQQIDQNYTHEMHLVIMDINQAIINIEYYLSCLKQPLEEDIYMPPLEEDIYIPPLEEDIYMPPLEEDIYMPPLDEAIPHLYKALPPLEEDIPPLEEED